MTFYLFFRFNLCWIYIFFCEPTRISYQKVYVLLQAHFFRLFWWYENYEIDFNRLRVQIMRNFVEIM